MENAANPADPLSILELVTKSTPVAKGVLLLLLIFSVVSWAIIITKFFVYRRARKEDKMFLKIFFKSDSLTNIYNFARELKFSPIARVFLTGYHELYVFKEISDKRGSGAAEKQMMVSPKDLKGIELALTKSTNHEVEKLGHRLDFLATTGSTTPFIGLFGTVWGIMHSFRMIGVKGSASIGGVAPGIAEALIATAAGLVAAIPAVVFFNYLNSRIHGFNHRMEDFSSDFIYMIEKDFMSSAPDPVRMEEMP
ncbi:MAG: protein TolQ [Nitrospinaceae bacterium]|nr:protein TolQ [Nitrospinaceae bacterium]NIR56581.1 protein TolQ [Nitrospinaceae bacterium]NIS87043.1 protein TolQ [Nitrospinaceae bacterium]NIT83887.1 protein TolQ [Nitrospinaceae bacterium]NIU46090.1 protein TolQ [Nitrospinaceae bacterium]